jgi:hypothetical protein
MVISNEVDDDDQDEDDDAATHVLPSKEVLGDTDLAELAELARRARPARTAPPPIPSRVPPPAAPPRPHGVAPEPAWAEEDYNETLTYGEQADADELPTAIPPQAGLNPPAPHEPVGHFYPGSMGSVAPRRPIHEQPAPQYDRTAISSPEMQRPLAYAPGTDLPTKLLLALIVLLAIALAVVLVLIVRR